MISAAEADKQVKKILQPRQAQMNYKHVYAPVALSEYKVADHFPDVSKMVDVVVRSKEVLYLLKNTFEISRFDSPIQLIS